ncbi:hypothetical protein V5E97_06930 [Singulisphaera sp. Ch08]|uniref:Peptidase C39-like domain-containing protein n=1 Tax=Singulisphaera sp. Ch08 TaxID=3120278 RepID=A0AAU7CJX3_9BACT
MKKYLFVFLLIPALALAQTPDHRGEAVTKSTMYRGVKADAPIPGHLHFHNEGGSDGQGLCVICSVIINGRYQKVPGLAGGKDSDLWRAAKAAPGGYSDDKLKRLIQRVMPGEKYASYVGTGSPKDRELLERVSKAGYPIGVTMNTGQLYGYRPIHHMVSLIYYRRGGWACIVDNNRPGFYSWMPADEFDRRWVDQGMVWAWWWTRLPVLLVGGFTLFFVAGAIFLAIEFEVERRQILETES